MILYIFCGGAASGISPDDIAVVRELGVLLDRSNQVDGLRRLLDAAEEAGIAPEKLGYLTASLAMRDGRPEEARRLLLLDREAVDTVLRARLMIRIAERLAAWEGSRALVTGESIGQVASQTLENMTTIGSVATMEMLRPLVGMDKEEVTADAHRIGTYEISILPDEDCCQLFTPRAPATRARRDEVDAAESSLPLAELIEMAVGGAVVEDFKHPVVQSRVRR